MHAPLGVLHLSHFFMMGWTSDQVLRPAWRLAMLSEQPLRAPTEKELQGFAGDPGDAQDRQDDQQVLTEA